VDSNFNKAYKWLLYFALTGVILSIAAASYLYITKPKMGYVNNVKLLTEYKGVEDLKKQYQEHLQSWQANMDTLTAEFKNEVMVFERDKTRMSAAQKASVEKYLGGRQEELYRYKSSLEQKAKEEEAKYNKAILDQVNKYVLEYGKANHYDYIFGVTEDGNILFAKEGEDITAQVLIFLNAKYEGLN
jgi:outer membrane protein